MRKKDIFFFTLGPLAASILSVITIPILAWNFTVDDIGRLSFLQMLISFSVLFFSFGLDEAYLREFHEVANESRLLKTVTLPGLLVITIVSLVVFITDPGSISKLLFDIDDPVLSIAATIGALSALILRFLMLILRIKEESLKYALVGLVPKVFQISFVLICVYFLNKSSLLTLILSYVFPSLCGLLCCIIYVRGDIRDALLAKINLKELKQYMAYGAPLVFAGMGSWGLVSLDKLFLRGMSSMEQLGIYSVAASIAAIVGVLTGILNTILAPIIYKMSAKGTYTPKNQIVITDRILAATLIIMSIGALTKWMVPLFFPPAYKNIDAFILCCAASPLLYTLSEVSSIGINLSRKTSFVFFAILVALITNSVGNYFLVPTYGAPGAAVATAFGFYVYFVVKVVAANWLQHKVPVTKLLVLPLICISLMVLEVFFAESYNIFTVLWSILGILFVILFKTQLLELKSLVVQEVRARFQGVAL